VKEGKTRVKVVDAEVELPLGKTCAPAVTGYVMLAPLQTFWENNSNTKLEFPAGSGLGRTSKARFIDVSPRTESSFQKVRTVFVKFYKT
jgi:hypothetical protein